VNGVGGNTIAGLSALGPPPTSTVYGVSREVVSKSDSWVYVYP
jgi:hypothetical protein